jgi:hypothetical protein
MTEMTITPEAISAITTSMIGITQLIKWAGVDTKHAPPILAVLSVSVVLLWVFAPFAFQVIVAASLVMMGASGVYGFATRQSKPPDAPPPPPAPSVADPPLS